MGKTAFQSTHPRGCDEASLAAGRRLLSFNPRTREGATAHCSRPTTACCVSIHAPARVRPFLTACSGPSSGFQSTHPRGCDAGQFVELLDGHVSIHAPARVRHGKTFYVGGKKSVSIHAPARVRHLAAVDESNNHQFQSTHPRGCDHQRARLRHVGRDVSIHAPARVRHAQQTGFPIVRRVSIHAPARVRLSTIATVPAGLRFQSTHPRGCDGLLQRLDAQPYPFQSTHPRGCDATALYRPSLRRVFQSTHPRGCDLLFTAFGNQYWCFNPRTREGATSRVVPLEHFAAPCFNPRTREGATSCAYKSSRAALFQSTHPRGCDLVTRRAPDAAQRLFQSTHPRGCDLQRLPVGAAQAVSIHAPARVRHGCGGVPLVQARVSIHAPARVRPCRGGNTR